MPNTRKPTAGKAKTMHENLNPKSLNLFDGVKNMLVSGLTLCGLMK